MTAIALSPDGRLLATGGRDGRVILWPLGGGAARTARHEGPVRDLVFADEGQLLVSASEDSTVRGWATASAGELWRHRLRSAATEALVSPNGRYVAVLASGDRAAHILSTRSGDELDTVAQDNR